MFRSRQSTERLLCPIVEAQTRTFYAKQVATSTTAIPKPVVREPASSSSGASLPLAGLVDRLHQEQKIRQKKDRETARSQVSRMPAGVPLRGEEQWQFNPKIEDLNRLSVGKGVMGAAASAPSVSSSNFAGLKDFTDLEVAIPRPLRKRLEAFRGQHGIRTPTPAQAASLGPIFEGRDVVCVAPPGSGKTLAYLIPPLAAFTSTTLDNFGNVPTDSSRREASAQEVKQAIKERQQFQCKYCGHDVTEVSMCVETGLPHPPPEQLANSSSTGSSGSSGSASPNDFSTGPPSAKPFLIVLAPRNELVLQIGQVVKDLTRGMQIKVVALQRSTLNGWAGKDGDNLGEDPEDGDADPTTGDRVHPNKNGRGANGFNYNNPCKDGCDVLVGTPMQVIRMLRKKAVTLSNLKTIVMDELDEYFTWALYETTQWILSMLPKGSVRRPQRLWFGATCPAVVMKHLGPQEGLVDDNVRFITGSSKEEGGRRTRDSNIRQHVEMLSPTERYNKLRSFFSMPRHVSQLAQQSGDFKVFSRWNAQQGAKMVSFEPSEKVLLFVNNLGTMMDLRDILTEHLAKPESLELYGRQLQVNTIRSSDPEDQRQYTLRCFNRKLIDTMPKVTGDQPAPGQANVVDILIVTSGVGRGVHFDGVKYVILFDTPESIVDYEHHVGRAARGLGDEGVAITYFCPADTHMATDLVHHLKKSGQVVPTRLQEFASMPLAETYTKLIAPHLHKKQVIRNQPELNKYHPLPVKGKDFPKYVPTGHFVQLMRQWKESSPRHLKGEADKIQERMVD